MHKATGYKFKGEQASPISYSGHIMKLKFDINVAKDNKNKGTTSCRYFRNSVLYDYRTQFNGLIKNAQV